MTKNPFINALAAILYIALVVMVLNYGPEAINPEIVIIVPMVMLALLTFSVAMMAYIFFFRPIQLYLDKKKKQGIKLFLQTLAVFGVITVILGAIAFSSPFFMKNKDEPNPVAFREGLIELYEPMPDEIISSPLTVTGKARGYWFFEGSFPVILTDWDGLIIAEGYATAQGEWMTEDYVPFVGTLTFEKPAYGEKGSLILQKDNPSGLPENDDALEISIRFQ